MDKHAGDNSEGQREADECEGAACSVEQGRNDNREHATGRQGYDRSPPSGRAAHPAKQFERVGEQAEHQDVVRQHAQQSRGDGQVDGLVVRPIGPRAPAFDQGDLRWEDHRHGGRLILGPVPHQRSDGVVTVGRSQRVSGDA